AQRELRELRSLGRGKLAVGASTTIGSYLVPSVFGELHRLHPGVQLELEIANTELTRSAVLENRLDVGLIEGSPTSDLLDVETLAADEMVVIASPGDPALALAPLRATALRELPLLVREQGSGSREVVEAALASHGLTIRPIMSLGGTEALKNAVRHGLGVAIVSRLTVEHELATGRLAELTFSDLTIRRDLYVITLKGKRQSPAAVAFLTLLRQRQHSLRASRRGDVYAI
ncbi:MAG TPA: LysR substrate-binding domain-containing protein, partial [Polyangiales bacterium]|nr:LysR substrate-binding domain-containing protein [Polyangiales bacterium]